MYCRLNARNSFFEVYCIQVENNIPISFQLSLFHPIITLSWIASSGNPRKISALRSSKINPIACRKLVFASSTVSFCPLAPGASGQIAQKPPYSAVSMIAVTLLSQ
jgi:hypothetical protein